MLATRHLSKNAGKNRLIGKKRPKKAKSKNEKGNGRRGDSRAGNRRQEIKARSQKSEFRRWNKGAKKYESRYTAWKGKLLRVLRV